jgi:hypothetical protein
MNTRHGSIGCCMASDNQRKREMKRFWMRPLDQHITGAMDKLPMERVRTTNR